MVLKLQWSRWHFLNFFFDWSVFLSSLNIQDINYWWSDDKKLELRFCSRVLGILISLSQITSHARGKKKKKQSFKTVGFVCRKGNRSTTYSPYGSYSWSNYIQIYPLSLFAYMYFRSNIYVYKRRETHQMDIVVYFQR